MVLRYHKGILHPEDQEKLGEKTDPQYLPEDILRQKFMEEGP